MTQSHRENVSDYTVYDSHADTLADRSEEEIAAYLESIERSGGDSRYRWRRPERRSLKQARLRAHRRDRTLVDWESYEDYDDGSDWQDR